MSGLIPCQLTGPGINRQTTVYVHPDRIEKTVAKYQSLGQHLCGPGINTDSPIRTAAESTASAGPPARPAVAKNAKGVICLNTGQFYPSVFEAAKSCNLSAQMLGYHLRGVTKQAKGRRLRYATGDEVAKAMSDAAWTFAGPLLPLIEPGTRKF